MNAKMSNDVADQVDVEVLPAKPKRNKPKRKAKSLKERIETAIQQQAASSASFDAYRIKTTGQLCYEMPWIAGTPRPWLNGYTRVFIPLDEPTSKGKWGLTQIVRNEKLERADHGRII